MNHEQLLASISKSLKRVEFGDFFFNLCNRYSDYENHFDVKRKDVSNILKDINYEMNSSSKESLFYNDYDFKDFKLRFILPFKHGFIDCSYLYWNQDNSIRIYGGFRENLNLVDISLKDQLKYLNPIATNLDDLKIIINKVIDMHEIFIKTLSEELEVIKNI